MARELRIDAPGLAFHVLNRRVGRLPLFERPEARLAWLLVEDRWPVALPKDWVRLNRPQSGKELKTLRRSVNRGVPYGEPSWQQRTAARLKLASSLRDPWRPKKRRKDKNK